MTSGPTFNPPASQAGFMARARIQSVAVKLISAPNGTTGHISGTVSGQNPQNGATMVETERGLVEIAFQDRSTLPKGTKVDIDLPRGTSQQAHIRLSSDQSPASSPSLNQASLDDAAKEAQLHSSASLARSSNLGQNTLETAVLSRQIGDSKAPVATVAKGNLENGQFVRLIPLPPGSPELAGQTASPLPLDEFLSALVKVIGSKELQLPAQTEFKNQLLTLLSKIALPPDLFSSSNPEHKALVQKISALLQSLPQQSTQNAPSMSSGRGFNPTTPVDVQVLGISSRGAPPLSASIPNNFVTVPLTLPTTAPSVSGQNPVAGQKAQNPVFFSFHPQAITLPSPVSNAASLSTQAPVTIAQVTGFTPQTRLPILSVPVPTAGFSQNYVMQFAAHNLSADSPSGSLPAPLFVALYPASSSPTATPAPVWDSLDQLLLLLQSGGALQNQASASALAAQNMAQILPSPVQPHLFGSMALFFLSVLRSGDIENWMPQDALQMLRQMTRGQQVFGQLKADLAQMQRMDQTILPNDWRGIFLPFLWEQQVQKVPLYYKDMSDPSEKDAKDRKRRLRFLFDLTLSRMGGVQVDGFLQAKQLDLIVRTKSPLSHPMQTHMKKLYAGAVGKSDLTGELNFQSNPDQWVNFMTDHRSPDHQIIG